jgi:hypothetical protein
MATLPANKAPPEPAFQPLKSTPPSVPITPKATQGHPRRTPRHPSKQPVSVVKFLKSKIGKTISQKSIYSEKGDPPGLCRELACLDHIGAFTDMVHRPIWHTHEDFPKDLTSPFRFLKSEITKTISQN